MFIYVCVILFTAGGGVWQTPLRPDPWDQTVPGTRQEMISYPPERGTRKEVASYPGTTKMGAIHPTLMISC